MNKSDYNTLAFLFSLLSGGEREYQEQEHFNNGIIKFNPIKVNEDYAKKWNVSRTNDFIVLTKNNEIIRDTLYRVGGIGTPKPTDNYFLLLKYVEAYYSDNIMKMSKSKDNKYLDGRWCILDKYGNEKITFEGSSNSPYLVSNSCIYSIEKKYYNIETGQIYCEYSSGSMESTEFLFLETKYDKDKSKRGVLRINKKDGSFVLFK